MRALTLAPVLTFALTLCSFQEPQTVALILGPEPTRVEIVTVAEAEKQYAQLSKQTPLTEEEHRRFAALAISLETVPCSEQELSGGVTTEASRACQAQRAAGLL